MFREPWFSESKLLLLISLSLDFSLARSGVSVGFNSTIEVRIFRYSLGPRILNVVMGSGALLFDCGRCTPMTAMSGFISSYWA